MIPVQSFFDFFKPIILSAWALTGTDEVPAVAPTLALWYPNAPMPNAPAFVISTVLSRMSDSSQLGDVDAQGMQPVSDQAEVSITITGIGKGTVSALTDVATSCRKPSAVRAASMLNISFVDRPTVTDISTRLNQVQYEERGTLNTTMRFVNVVSDNVGIIETVNAEGTFSGSVQEGATQEITVTLS